MHPVSTAYITTRFPGSAVQFVLSQTMNAAGFAVWSSLAISMDKVLLGTSAYKYSRNPAEDTTECYTGSLL